MIRFFLIHALLIMFCLTNASCLVVDEARRAEYHTRVTEVVTAMPEGSIMLDYCKTKVLSVANILGKEEISDEDYGNVYSAIIGIIPEFSGVTKILLDKILVFSIFHLLNSGSYVSIGSSFTPSNEELGSITLDGTNLNQMEFVRIQNTLDRDAESGTLDEHSFSRALGSVRELRLRY